MKIEKGPVVACCIWIWDWDTHTAHWDLGYWDLAGIWHLVSVSACLMYDISIVLKFSASIASITSKSQAHGTC